MALVLTVENGQCLKVGELGSIEVRVASGPRGGKRVQLVIDGDALKPIRIQNRAPEPGPGPSPEPLEKPDRPAYKR